MKVDCGLSRAPVSAAPLSQPFPFFQTQAAVAAVSIDDKKKKKRKAPGDGGEGDLVASHLPIGHVLAAPANIALGELGVVSDCHGVENTPVKTEEAVMMEDSCLTDHLWSIWGGVGIEAGGLGEVEVWSEKESQPPHEAAFGSPVSDSDADLVYFAQGP